jgi:hypothetical protein
MDMTRKNSNHDDTEQVIRITGAISPNRRKWVTVTQGENSVTFPLAEIMKNPQNVKSKLADADIIILGSSYGKFLKDIQTLSKFRPRNLLEQPGWTGNCFALQDGTVFAPGREKASVVFDVDVRKCARSGTLREWLANVAEPLTGQSIPMFMMMAMFVAPILKLTHRAGNFGIELVGSRGKGKSTLLQLMATVIGGGIDDPSCRYWNSCNTTLNALERKAQQHADLPLLLDDATNFAAEDSGAKRGHKFKAFVFGLAQAETRDRMYGNKQQAFRTAYVLTSNLSLNEVIADVAELEAGATADRLLTLNVDLQKHGIFDYIPEPYTEPTAYARALVESMAAYHGTAMPRFLKRLVNHKAEDEANLREGIRRRAETFIRQAGVDLNDGSAVRVAEVFGLIMAAGLLAKKYGVLPAAYDCEAAAMSAYRLFLASTKRVSYDERLLTYASDPAVLDMDSLGLKHVSAKQFRTAPGFIRSHRDGHREFIVNRETFQNAFPDWRSLLNDPEVDHYLQKEGRRGERKLVKRELRRGHPNDRFYCFTLPKKFGVREA